MKEVLIAIPAKGVAPFYPCIRLSVGLFPLANSSRIEKIQGVFTEHHIDGKIIVADNSTDRTDKWT